MKLKDKVAIVTGGGRGIGRAYALRFAEEGAKVVVADIIFDNAQKVADEIKAKGGEALALRTDISDVSSTQEMAEKTLEQFGRIDILMNNAAIYYGVGMKRWDTWAPEDWDRMFAINVKGGWLCIKAVAPHMITQGKGKIINIASSTADTGYHGLLPYTCSKGAVITMTKAMARALGRHNINVNCISPGYTMSEATAEMPGRSAEGDDMVVKVRALRREEQPDDLAGTAVFLASEDSDFVTGQTFSVDGGEVLR
jgi:3-oxoacyl-[acyl-carrier protein] reductase